MLSVYSLFSAKQKFITFDLDTVEGRQPYLISLSFSVRFSHVVEAFESVFFAEKIMARRYFITEEAACKVMMDDASGEEDTDEASRE